MKGIKKLLTGIAAAVLVMGSALTVSAEPSAEAGPSIGGESEGLYVILPDGEAFFELEGSEIYDQIRAFNEKYFENAVTDTDIEALLKDYPDVLKAVKGKKLVTRIFDLHPVNGGNKDVHGVHKVASIIIPELQGYKSGAVFLHYDEIGQKWEIITPDSVDYATGGISGEFEHLSPFAVLANVDTAGGNQGGTGNNNTGSNQNSNQNSNQSSTASGTTTDGQTTVTSPQTEGHSTWALWLVAAAVMAAGGFAMVYRKRTD